MKQIISDIWNDPKKSKLVVGVVSLGAGFGIGYFLGRRSKRELFEVPVNQLEFDFDMVELEDIKSDSVRVEDMPIPVDARPVSEETKDEIKDFIEQKLQEKVYSNQITEADVEESFETNEYKVLMEPELVEMIPQTQAEEHLVVHNVFSESDEEWDFEKELQKRNPSEPYILHRDEFFENDLDLSQVTLTYYEGDDILADEEDSPIYNHKQVTGPLRFGHGSGDPNVVYVRNVKRKIEYEILRDPGLYSVEVLGLEIEENNRAKDLKHSNNRKFREE